MVLTAYDGHWLTQKVLKEGEERQFWKKMHLAYSLSGADFEQWTDEQKEAYIPPEHEEEISAEEALNIITGTEE